MSSAAESIPQDAEFITAAQAAHLLQVSKWKVMHYVSQGRLCRYGEGRIWRFRRAEVLSLLPREAPKPTGSDAPPSSAHDRAAAILKRGAR